MKENRKPKRFKKVAGATIVFVVVVLFIVYPASVYHVRGYVCVNTGSSRGYREWFWGTETGQWYRQSSLESFMRSNYPNELELKWVSYQGTGVNCFGQAMSHGHGMPGPIISFVPNNVLDQYVDSLDDPERKAMYDLFVSGDGEAIEQKVLAIYEWSARSAEVR